MVRRINEAFDETEFDKLKKDKERIAKSKGLKRISWHDYILLKGGFI